MDSSLREKLQRLIASIQSDGKPSIEEAEAQLRVPDLPIYHDVPILHTAAQMANYTPPKIREMRSIARDFDIYHQSAAMTFYAQAKFMEDFEDDYPQQVSFYQYMPTYQVMSTQQLRAYFTWRTRLRRGEYVEAPRAMAILYLYELLNGIGVPSVEAGYEALCSFRAQYLHLAPELAPQLERWLRDYVIYHGLDPALIASNTAMEQTIHVVRHYAEFTAQELCAALSRLSTYRLESSRLFRARPDDVAQVVYRVYDALWHYYDNHRKNGIFEKLIGHFSTSRYWMFQGAVFYVQSPHADTDYECSETLRYSCRNDSWTETSLQRDHAASPELGRLLKEIDRQMRQSCDFGYPLQPVKCSKIFQSIVQKAVDAWAKEQAAEAARQEARARQEEAARQTIHIDVSQLDAIRRAAEETQNRLIVEEAPEEKPPAPPVPAAAPEPAEAPASQLLDAPQLRLLRCLLTGEPYDAWLRSEGLLLSVLVDSINDQLYDQFSDTVLLWDGDRPAVIEDYLDELKGLVLT